MTKRDNTLRNRISALLALLATHSALGQSAPAEPAAAETDNSVLQDVVVYSERRAKGEAAQRVPMAITAVDQRVLQDTNSVSVADIGALAPSVQTTPVGTFPGFPNFSIRGIGVNSSIRSVDPAINILQDGMVLAYQAGAVVSTFDLESVEILRGPQGVLFGRNATGGAIVLRTRRPSDRFTVLGDVSYGNFNDVNVNTSVEGPLGSPNALGKLAILYHYNGGTIANTNDGTFVPAKFNPTGARSDHATGNVGDIDELVVKPTFYFILGDTTRLSLFTQYQRSHDDGTITRNFQPTGLPTTQVTTDYGFTPDNHGYSTNVGNVGYLHLSEQHVIAELENTVGPGLLTTNLAYRHVAYDSTSNLAGTPYTGFIFLDNVERNDEYSFESRYNVNIFDPLALTAGVFYLRSDVNVGEQRQTAGPAGAALPLVYTYGQFDQLTNAAAGYLNFDWSITQDLKLSAGGRYSDEKKRINYDPLTRCGVVSDVGCPQTALTAAKRWTNFSPRAVLNYEINRHQLVYASYTAGFRSGNYNPRTTDTSGVGVGPANPENVNAYEIGAKTTLLDQRMRLNIAAYQNNYRDIQQVLTAPGGGVVQTLLNAANARIRGVDFEFLYKPIPEFELSSNLGYTNAAFLHFNVPVAGVADPTELSFAKIPKWTSYTAGTYTYGAPWLNGSLSFRLSYDWRSKFATDLPNTPGLWQSAYGLTNANITYTHDAWSVSLYGRNLANVYYTETKARNFAWGDLGGAPRTYGLRAIFKL